MGRPTREDPSAQADREAASRGGAEPSSCWRRAFLRPSGLRRRPPLGSTRRRLFSTATAPPNFPSALKIERPRRTEARRRMTRERESRSRAAAADEYPMALVRGDADELAIAGEVLSTWLPFLSAGLCPSCVAILHGRVGSLLQQGNGQSNFLAADGSPEPRVDWTEDDVVVPPPPPRMSWADMAQEYGLAAAAEEDAAAMAADDGEEVGEVGRPRTKLTREQRELHRFRNVVRRDDFICFEKVKGRVVNIVAGLELHDHVFSAAEQGRIVQCVYNMQEMGKRGKLKDRTYTEPEKWMRGKGRVTIQFGCCYNYAKDNNGNPPGILQNFVSDPIPQLFKGMIKRLVRWRILPPDCVPDSCIVNMYDPGDCIPPHIDSHDFVRPFCTVSFVSECNILFGTNLTIDGPGEFTGSIAIPLPVGSVLVINGNGADVAKHCIPAVPSKRISITFRRMDPAKRPFSFQDDPELLNITPLQAASRSSSDDGQGKQLEMQSHGESLGDGLNELSHKRKQMQSLGDELNELSHKRKYVIDKGAARERNPQIRMEHRQLAMINRTINDAVLRRKPRVL